ncbi:MAG: polysaccharide deacetylase family protein [Candidatus Roizmanbacteria bacterium]|nr:polysaccharide deacetylase family protein [Candidatus Roizmanbacteria bacterium]
MKEHPSIPTLVFHSVREHQGKDLFTIAPSHFSDILSFVAERFGTIDMQAIRDGRYASEGSPVLITFDDGYKDNAEIVVPILEQYDVKALFFLLPKYLGQNNLWNTRADVILDHLNPDQVTELLQSGQSIGSHGMTHHKLTKFEDETVMLELRQSRQMLEDMFEVSVDCFAYPYGVSDDRIQRLASGYYQYGFATDQAPVDWNDRNNMEIRREFIWPHHTLADVEELIVQFGTYDNNPMKTK